MKIKRIICTVLSAAVAAASLPAMLASAYTDSSSVMLSKASEAVKTISVPIEKGKTTAVTVNIKSSSPVCGLMMETEFENITLDSNSSAPMIERGSDGFPNVVITKERISVLFPESGYDCSKGVDTVKLVFKGKGSATEGTARFTILEFYGTDTIGSLPDSGISFSVKSDKEKHEHTVVSDPAVPATCTSEGKTEGSHCSVCGEVIKAQTTIPKAAHTVVSDPAVPATCTSEGKTEGSHCSVCGEVIKAQTTIPKAAHTVVSDPAVPATCKSEGKTEGSHCSVCGEVIKAQTTIPKAAHTVVSDPAVPATCTSEGKTEGSHCSVCGEVIKAQTTVPKTAHSFVNGVCTVCGESDGSSSLDFEYIYGDVDFDRNVTSEDALFILRLTVNLATADTTVKFAADVDKSGDCTAADALEVLRYSVGLGSSTVVGDPFHI